MTPTFRAVGRAFAMAVLTITCVVLVSGSATTFADPPKGATCGGITGIPCPEGCICVDDPGDDCNPKRGGADCSGTCKRAPTSPPDQDCSGGAPESFVDGSFSNCDRTKEPGVEGNLSCSQTYTCTANGAWLCINMDGTPTL